MFNMIKFEIYKLFRSKNFYICSGLMLGLVLLMAVLTRSSPGGAKLDTSGVEFANMSIQIGILILAVFISTFVCDDNTHGTIRNIYAKGYSRNKVYFAKFIVSIISSIVIMVACILFSLLLAEILFDSRGIEKVDIFILILGLLYIFFYCIIYFAVSIITGKKGAAIALNMVAPAMFVNILSLIDVLADFKIKFSKYTMRLLYDNILTYYDFEYNYGTALSDECVSNFEKFILVGVIYTAVVLVTSFLVNRRKEV